MCLCIQASLCSMHLNSLGDFAPGSPPCRLKEFAFSSGGAKEPVLGLWRPQRTTKTKRTNEQGKENRNLWGSWSHVPVSLVIISLENCTSKTLSLFQFFWLSFVPFTKTKQNKFSEKKVLKKIWLENYLLKRQIYTHWIKLKKQYLWHNHKNYK